MRVEITIFAGHVWVELAGPNRATANASLVRHLHEQKIPIAFACDVLSRASFRVDIIPKDQETRRVDIDAAFAHVVGAVCVWASRMHFEIVFIPSPAIIKDREWKLELDGKGGLSWKR